MVNFTYFSLNRRRFAFAKLAGANNCRARRQVYMNTGTSMKVALTGNPNSGKTTLFNAITGRIEHVGNWPGVTIDKKEGGIKKSLNKTNMKITAVDLPGAYSMSPFTSEESITSTFVKNENPDVIINIVDASNLSRSLFFTTQLLELGIPVVVALNKSDLTRKKKTWIDVEGLSRALGCPVVETVSTSGRNNGLKELVSTVISLKGETQSAPFDSKGVNMADRSSVEASDKKRYEFVKGIVSKVEKREISSNKQTRQDAADRIIAHKWLGIPIFALVMWAVFSISQAHLGPFLADILVGWIDSFYVLAEGMLADGTSPVLSAILLDGIIYLL
jgi:ferrous iron transport protein B